MRSFTGTMTINKGSHYGHCPQWWGDGIGIRAVRPGGFPIRPAGELGESRKGDQLRAIGSNFGPRPGLPLLGSAIHDDIGLYLHQVFVSHSPSRHCARGKALRHDISPIN